MKGFWSQMHNFSFCTLTFTKHNVWYKEWKLLCYNRIISVVIIAIYIYIGTYVHINYSTLHFRKRNTSFSQQLILLNKTWVNSLAKRTISYTLPVLGEATCWFTGKLLQNVLESAHEIGIYQWDRRYWKM